MISIRLKCIIRSHNDLINESNQVITGVEVTKYIWQKEEWPNFSWDEESLASALSNAKKAQGFILAQADIFDLKSLGEIIFQEALTTSEIEGHSPSKNSLRSSVAQRLGLPTAGFVYQDKSSDGLVELLIDATTCHKDELNKEKLWAWQAALFPSGHSGIQKITVGSWRTGAEPMKVISGQMGKEVIHYEAPPSKSINKEISHFLKWWNHSNSVDGIIRAAVAHFWLVSIHPFDDGNGRIARAITDMALAQDEQTSKRLYSLSSQIIKERKLYYNILEYNQKSSGDITSWIKWFLEMYARAIENSKELIHRSLFINKFYKHYSNIVLNKRQQKVIKKLIELLPNDFEGGLTNRKYVSITKVSPETAKRDLKFLVEAKILKKNRGKGRSVSYSLNRDL